MSADAIRKALEDKRKLIPNADLCLQIVNYVDDLPADERRMLTYRSFVKAAGKKAVDADLVGAVTILVSSVDALDMLRMFEDEDGYEWEISPEDFAEARETGEFIHPKSGEPVPDFEKRVFPFFVPSARFSGT